MNEFARLCLHPKRSNENKFHLVHMNEICITAMLNHLMHFKVHALIQMTSNYFLFKIILIIFISFTLDKIFNWEMKEREKKNTTTNANGLSENVIKNYSWIFQWVCLTSSTDNIFIIKQKFTLVHQVNRKQCMVYNFVIFGASFEIEYKDLVYRSLSTSSRIGK